MSGARANDRPAVALVDGRPVQFTAKEFAILGLFVEHPRQVFSRDQLFELIWGDFGDRSAVGVYIRKLREKIEADPGHPELLVTVWGVGFTAGSGASAEQLKSPAGSRKTPALELPRGYFATLVVPGLNGSSRWLAALLAAIGTFVAVLTAFSLLARRWVVRPLSALSKAVDTIAGGSAFRRSRPSRVREIDQLVEALAAMDEGLRAAAERELQREQERRFLIRPLPPPPPAPP